MYANMSSYDQFKKNVVSDDRSYSNETFDQALKVITSTNKNIPVDADHAQKFQ